MSIHFADRQTHALQHNEPKGQLATDSEFLEVFAKQWGLAMGGRTTGDSGAAAADSGWNSKWCASSIEGTAGDS